MKNLLFLLPLYTAILSAQPTIEWQKSFGGSSYDRAYSIQQTSDGGYITAGFTTSYDGDVFGQHGGYDFWVLKLSSTGSIQWKRVLGGTGNDEALTIHQTYDGGYFVSGYSESNNFDVSGNHGGPYDGWVVKLSSTGATEWQRTLGGSSWDDVWASQPTADHGYILAGRSGSSDGDLTENKGYLDVWVVKLNETGDIEWQKTFGGSLNDVAAAVHQTSDGGFIINAETYSTDGDVTGLHGNVDIWVLKLSASGALEWQKTLGGQAGDFCSDVIQVSDGGYAVLGYVGSTIGDVTGQHGVLDYWIVKLSSSGELEWQKALGGSERDYGRSLVEAVDGGYVVIGESHSTDGDIDGNLGSVDFWLVKVSATGELVWQKSLGGTDQESGFAIANTSDNGFVLAGGSWSLDGDVTPPAVPGKANLWVVKIAPESVGTEEAPDASTGALDIYPNPATQSVSLRVASEIATLSISVSDMLGREVLRQEIMNGGQVAVGNLAVGLYLVSAVAPDGKAYKQKLERI